MNREKESQSWVRNGQHSEFLQGKLRPWSALGGTQLPCSLTVLLGPVLITSELQECPGYLLISLFFFQGPDGQTSRREELSVVR